MKPALVWLLNLALQAAPAAPAKAPAKPATPAAARADSIPDDADGEVVFEDGVVALQQGSARRAAERFWQYLAKNEQTADHYEWAEFYLAKALQQLGLNHAAVEYFYNVAKERKRPELLPQALRELERVREAAPYDDELVDRDLLADADFGALPPSAKSFVEYQQGRIDLVDGRVAWAQRHFERLHATGDDDVRVQHYGLRAKLALALADIRETRAKDTKAKREKREAARVTLVEIGKSDLDDFEVKNEAKRVAAELFFEDKKFKEALRIYDDIQVPFLSQEEATLFLEKAWSRYYDGDARGALGILLSLDAPSYRRYFSPERFVLKALAYKQLCHYAAAKASAREFLRRYETSLVEMRQSRDPLTDPVVRAATVQRRKPKRMFAFLESLQQERQQAERFDNRFGLVTQLTRIYELKIAQVARALDRVVKDEATVVANDLLEYEEQARLVDYEVSLEVFRRLQEGAGRKTADQEPPIPVASQQVFYPFNGEYWNDELHNYRFRIENRCFGEELLQ